METMAAKKRKSERRETHLGIRLTDAEAKWLRDAADALSMDQSTLARIALIVGVKAIRKKGIPPTVNIDD